MPATRLSGRVLARLTQAEACELNPHYRDDLQIARLMVHYAATGKAVLCSPHVLASYMVLGLHPDKVWPAIQARRKALGLCEEAGAPPVPKKAAQSVKLWVENTNAARAINSRGADSNDLRDQTISVPMAAPSIAALYRNPESPSSAKTRPFTYEEMLSFVEFSGASHSVRALTISALQARGKWPHEDGPASTVLSVAILGMMLEGVCCRSTVQRRIKRAVHLGFWRRTREANSWTNCPQCSKPRTTGKCECGYKGRSRDANGNWTGEFLRVPVYEFDIEKFRTAPRCREIRQFDARTYAEHKAAAKRGEHPNVAPWPSRTSPEQPPPKAPAPARPQEPLPQRDQPAAEHRGTERAQQVQSRAAERRRALRAGVVADMSKLMSDGMSEAEALKKICRSWGVAAEEARTILNECLFEPPERTNSPPPRQVQCSTCGDQRLVLNLNNGPGEKRLIPCPDCGVST
jgi:hypothetical protein